MFEMMRAAGDSDASAAMEAASDSEVYREMRVRL
jgi:hypothetical protein